MKKGFILQISNRHDAYKLKKHEEEPTDTFRVYSEELSLAISVLSAGKAVGLANVFPF